MAKTGTALLIGGRVFVPPSPSEADITAGLQLLSPAEHRQLVRGLKFELWKWRHKRLALLIDCVLWAAVVFGR